MLNKLICYLKGHDYKCAGWITHSVDKDIPKGFVVNIFKCDICGYVKKENKSENLDKINI
jgi:hypothetical protein